MAIFSKTTKLHEPVGRVQFCCLWKIISAYLSQISREITSLLVDNLHEKRITEGRDGQNSGSACALFVICTRVAWKMYSFSVDHTYLIFFMYVIVMKWILELTLGLVSFLISLFFHFLWLFSWEYLKFDASFFWQKWKYLLLLLKLIGVGWRDV